MKDSQFETRFIKDEAVNVDESMTLRHVGNTL